MPEGKIKIEELRNRIDSIDRDILSMLNQRAELSVQIGKIKEHHNIPVYSAEREQALINSLCNQSEGPLAEPAIKRIFKLIMDESKEIQNRIRNQGQVPEE